MYHRPETYEAVQTPDIHETRILLLAICSHASSQDGNDFNLQQNVNYVYKVSVSQPGNESRADRAADSRFGP